MLDRREYASSCAKRDSARFAFTSATSLRFNWNASIEDTGDFAPRQRHRPHTLVTHTTLAKRRNALVDIGDGLYPLNAYARIIPEKEPAIR
jgi:hypothetical protein